MASVINLVWTNCEDLFANIDIESMFKRQRRIMSGGVLTAYPAVILINSAKITIGVSLAARFSMRNYSRLLTSDQSVPQDGPLFD